MLTLDDLTAKDYVELKTLVKDGAITIEATEARKNPLLQKIMETGLLDAGVVQKIPTPFTGEKREGAGQTSPILKLNCHKDLLNFLNQDE